MGNAPKPPSPSERPTLDEAHPRNRIPWAARRVRASGTRIDHRLQRGHPQGASIRRLSAHRCYRIWRDEYVRCLLLVAVSLKTCERGEPRTDWVYTRYDVHYGSGVADCGTPARMGGHLQ
jgi:hypothetical protein